MEGTFFGERVQTTVDSEIARYYIESYLQKEAGNQELNEEISELYRHYNEVIPSRKELKIISQYYSVDFASLFLADLLLRNECNRVLNEFFTQQIESTATIDPSVTSYRLLFVPGWDYVETGHVTGGDFAKPRELATATGFENYLVELPPVGSVEENAKFLAAEIARHNRSGKKLILVGASSAGPAIHLALGELLNEEELESVHAWLNIGGILQGSPLIDYFQEGPRRWKFNWAVRKGDLNKEAILSMGTRPSRSRFLRIKIESDLLIINYLGTPLSGQLSQYSKDKYLLLKSEGPNDGLTLLTDAIAPNSLTIVALGSDHYFSEYPGIDNKTVALMKLIITYLENDMAKSCSL